MAGGQEHWVGVFGARPDNELTWFEATPALSLELVRANLRLREPFIGIGPGASRLVDVLLDEGNHLAEARPVPYRAVNEGGVRMRLKLTILSVGISILSLVLPLALLQVYDRILPNQGIGSAYVIFSAAVVALLLSGLLRSVRANLFSRISAETDHANWTRLTRGVFAEAQDPKSIRRLAELPLKARDAGAGQSLTALYDAPFALVFLGLIWFLGGITVLGPILIVVVVAALLLLRAGADRRNRQALLEEDASLRLAAGDMTAKSEGLGPIGITALPLLRFWDRLGGKAQATERTERAAALQLDLLQTAGLATTVLVVGFGSAQVLSGAMTTGGLAACTLLGSRAVSQLLGSIAALLRRPDVRNAARRMGALPSLQPVSGLAPDRVAAALGLDTVSRGDVILLQGDDPHVEAAALASVSEAIWGHSDLPIDAVFVPARPKLLHGTLLDNLSGFEKAREEKAKQLAGDIGLDPMIGRLARGMSTEVGDGTGGGLSSGGVKRVGLVAALAASPSVLVLERPEVELDMDGVARLAAMIDAVRDDMVTVLTSSAPAIHELANIKSAVRPTARHEGRAA